MVLIIDNVESVINGDAFCIIFNSEGELALIFVHISDVAESNSCVNAPFAQYLFFDLKTFLVILES
jgi:hypothetical protein